MNRKTLIVLVSIIAVMCVGVGVAVCALYSGVSEDSDGLSVSDGDYRLFQAVPTDALLLLHSDRFDNLSHLLSDPTSVASCFTAKKLREFLLAASAADGKEMPNLNSSEAVLSFHYDGGLVPLLVVDVSRSGPFAENFQALTNLVSDSGMSFRSLDCSRLADGKSALASRNILLVSPSDIILKSSERHISRGISVLDKDEFCQTVSQDRLSGCTLFFPNSSVPKVMSSFCKREYSRNSEFLKTMSDWCRMSIPNSSDARFEVSGLLSGGDAYDLYMNVLRSDAPSESKILEILPSYTVSFISCPISDVKTFNDAAARFADAKGRRQKYAYLLDSLGKRSKVRPSVWAETLDIKEVATAKFYFGGKLDTVLLIRPGNPDPKMIFGPSSDIVNLGKDEPSVSEFPFFDYAAALYGSLFSKKQGVSCTFLSGWIVVGNEDVVEGYAKRKIPDTTLKSYISGSSVSGMSDLRSVDAVAYLCLSDNPALADEIFRPETAALVREQISTATFCPLMLKLTSAKNGRESVSIVSDRVSDIKVKAPEFGRDVVVEVPAGPFKVKNVGTGKTNTFYQQKNMYLCLNDENGKGLWAAPFQTPICGRVCNVDYYANGKIQFLFASGSKIYIIDRLGRFVKPFPVDLGKEILLGPDVYDFSGAKKYNILVLHKDNTIDMYNLQGVKPKDWKGITVQQETIMNLPERISAVGKTFWVVRTSLQTLVFPFYGGEPYSLGNNVKIRPDSPVTPVDSGVELTGYDGRKHILKLNKN
ncbi:MAG: hypothetical protein ACI395_06885 [Candidatus Cryptobacteroides sp.]